MAEINDKIVKGCPYLSDQRPRNSATTIDADRVIAAWHIVDERPADGGGVRVVIPADGVAIVR